MCGAAAGGVSSRRAVGVAVVLALAVTTTVLGDSSPATTSAATMVHNDPDSSIGHLTSPSPPRDFAAVTAVSSTTSPISSEENITTPEKNSGEVEPPVAPPASAAVRVARDVGSGTLEVELALLKAPPPVVGAAAPLPPPPPHTGSTGQPEYAASVPDSESSSPASSSDDESTEDDEDDGDEDDADEDVDDEDNDDEDNDEDEDDDDATEETPHAVPAPAPAPPPQAATKRLPPVPEEDLPDAEEMAVADERLLELMVRIAEDPRHWRRVHDQLQTLDRDLARVRHLEAAAHAAGELEVAPSSIADSDASLPRLVPQKKAWGPHDNHPLIANRWENTPDEEDFISPAAVEGVARGAKNRGKGGRARGKSRRPRPTPAPAEEESEDGEEDVRRKQLLAAGVLTPAQDASDGKGRKADAKHKHKERLKEKEHRQRERARNREKERQREKEREKEKELEKEREREKERMREREERERERELQALELRREREQRQRELARQKERERGRGSWGTLREKDNRVLPEDDSRATSDRGQRVGGVRAVSFPSTANGLTPKETKATNKGRGLNDMQSALAAVEYDWRPRGSAFETLKNGGDGGRGSPDGWPRFPPVDEPGRWPDFSAIASLRHRHHRPRHRQGSALEAALAKHREILANTWRPDSQAHSRTQIVEQGGGMRDQLNGGGRDALSAQQAPPAAPASPPASGASSAGVAAPAPVLPPPLGAAPSRPWPHFAYHRVTTSPQMLAAAAARPRNAYIAVSLVPSPPGAGSGGGGGGGSDSSTQEHRIPSPPPPAPVPDPPPANASHTSVEQQPLVVRSPPRDPLEVQLTKAAAAVAAKAGSVGGGRGSGGGVNGEGGSRTSTLPWSHARHLDRMQEQLRALSAVEERLRYRWLERERLRQMLRDGGTPGGAGTLLRSPRAGDSHATLAAATAP